MSRYPHDEDLYRIKNDEAFDPRTGRKYHLEEIPEPNSSSVFLLGFLIGAISLMFVAAQMSLPALQLVPLRWSSQAESMRPNPVLPQYQRQS